MNERIRQLALQAVEETQLLMIMEYRNFESTLYEKFAELIVAECLEVINKEHDEGIDRHGDYQLALYEAYREIKEHFGVEE